MISHDAFFDFIVNAVDNPETPPPTMIVSLIPKELFSSSEGEDEDEDARTTKLLPLLLPLLERAARTLRVLLVDDTFVLERGRERRKDEWGREIVWDLIVNDDDICFQHILPKLNSNDVKFLYGVNSETRKLMKRSSRESDLKEMFKVERDVLDIDVGVRVGAFSVGHV